MPGADHQTLLSGAATGLVGRTEDVARARQLLSRSPLVCLTGVGGVGKTRLARLVAWRVRRAFDAIWVIDAADLPPHGSLAELIGATLGVPVRPGRTAPDALVEHFSGRSTLLVLDTCEVIPDEVARLVPALLRACPRLRVLAASREALRVSGEVILTVDALAVPGPVPVSARELARVPSVALFVQRAEAAPAGFRLTADNRGAVADLCRRVGGLPLGIELAAALVTDGTLPLTEPSPPLSSWLDVPVPGPVARHESLHSCVAWSHRLVTPAARLLWARLAVFEDAFGLDDVQAVCADGELPADVLLDELATLVDGSVLARADHDGVAGYRLPGPLRAFGAEQLRDRGEEPALRDRHADRFRRQVTIATGALAGPAQAAALTALDRRLPDVHAAVRFGLDRPELRAATLRTLAALSGYWLVRGLPGQGRRRLGDALDRVPGPGAARAAAGFAAAVLAAHDGDLDQLRALAGRARSDLTYDLTSDPTSDLTSDPTYDPTYDPTSDDDHLAAARERVAGLAALLGADPAAAGEHLRSAVELCRRRGDTAGLVPALTELAVAAALAGGADRAAEAHAAVHALLADPDRPDGAASTFSVTSTWAVGLARWRHGDAPGGTDAVQRALRLARDLDDRRGSACCLEVLAWIAAGTGDPRRAATLLGAAAGPGADPVVLFPGLLADHERCERAVRRALGHAAFRAAFDAGRERSPDGVTALALGEPAAGRSHRSAGPDGAAARPAPGQPALTRREREVAELLRQGLTNREIAGRLVIAQRTAEGHVENIMAKLGVASRAQVAVWLARQDPPDGTRQRSSRPG